MILTCIGRAGYLQAVVADVVKFTRVGPYKGTFPLNLGTSANVETADCRGSGFPRVRRVNSSIHLAGERLPGTGTDLWYGRTDQIPARALCEHFLLALSPYERNRHANFKGDSDRDVYLLAHAMLRAALSYYFDKQPGEWRFEPEHSGKPRIVAPLPAPLEFSLSHTRGLAVCSFARLDPMGIDVESASRGAEMQEIVARQFADSERQMLGQWPQPLRFERSVWLWTAKEALLKAQGRGLSVPLDEVCLTWGSDGRVRLERRLEAGQSWHFVRFRIDGEFLGTLATARGTGPPRVFCVRDDTLHPHQGNVEESSDGCLELRV